jgi:hypothetical protein
MRYPFLFGLALAFRATNASARPDLKITTARRGPGRLADDVQTQFIRSDRMRTEFQGGFRQQLWPGGPSASFRRPKVAQVIRCDLGQSFTVNLDERKYSSLPYPRVPTEAEKQAYASRVPQAENRKPTVLVEISTKDTGERKEMFGYMARHVITTRTDAPLEDTTASKGFTTRNEYVTDGWYIDLDASISCVPKPAAGTFTYGFLTGSNDRQQADVPTLKLVGKPETGFPLVTKMTSRSTITQADGSKREFVNTNEVEVKELSSAALDPGMFEVPSKFERVSQMNLAPSPPLWARWLTQAHNYWMRTITRKTGPRA